MPLSRRQLLRGAALAAAAAPLRAFAVGRKTPREVAQLLPGMATRDGAGVQLTRIIGQPVLRHLDPFILLDRMHSNDPAAYERGFPDHPHRGFETVSVMLEGHMRHHDSRGNQGDIRGGGAQWMTAGRGIVHSEMPGQEGGWLSGFQLWINLPAAEKLCPPYYQDLAPERLAEGKLTPGGSALRLIAGRHDGLHGPVRDRPTAPFLATLTLEDDRPVELALPEGYAAFAFVAAGEVELGPERAAKATPEGSLALLGPGTHLRLRASNRRSVALVAAGKPLGEPIVQSGPFVMNTDAEIARAWADYRAGVLDQG